MTFSLELLIQHLQELSRQLPAVRHCPDVLDVVLRGEDVADPVASPQEAHHVRVVAATIGHIKALVSGDGLGGRIDSVPELVLRAQGRIVRSSLSALGELAADPSARRRLDTLVRPSFEQFDDWICYVAHELNGSAQGWISYREDMATDPAPYRAALREARVTLRGLAEQSKATPLLRNATSSGDWPALQEPCSHIVVALTIPIDVEFRIPLIMVSVPTRNALVERSS